ncbi:NADH dehydrogenase [ubiquinone] 1 beta subcomplex subunit 5, mitochondrial [Daktulosphaira vitifoliae]|uniref:NADH dehydrogenase [ubiquinone] 1 beta subcomplex subunit 5, mitochondrial n=1 Tax=Daktulosphaira vitifoliae TaxID=58002 RepID=UPI0021AAFF47|nr:NADH dehydrogenase [ubiquinone] 1 beta subcomplex subunit 5, mitochondrial [Daktulosphaira vitifoliae]
MTIWSSLMLISPYKRCLNLKYGRVLKSLDLVPVRNMGGHHMMIIKETKWQWTKFKDLIHFYVLVGVIPLTIVIAYTNIFIGPAQLAPIPEGYRPKHWEYHRHPITRWFARYIYPSPQQQYEKYLHTLYEEDEKFKIRMLTKEIEKKMKERSDYKSFYYRPISANLHRVSKESMDRSEEAAGYN